MKRALIIAAALIAVSAFAFDGTLGRYGLKEVKGDNALGINESAADCLDNFSWADVLGTNSPSRTSIEASYQFNPVLAGKKIANHAAVFTIEDRRGLFSGESYTQVVYTYNTTGNYASKIELYQGWKYNITKYLQLDIGGNFIFTDMPVYGDFRPATLGGGCCDSGNIYFGFIGDIDYLQPFICYQYDFGFYTSEFRAGINPKYDFDGALDGLTVGANIFGAYVHCDNFYYMDTIKATESYWYVNAACYAEYSFTKNFYARACVGYSYNTSDGVKNLSAYDIGPNANVFTSFSIGYAF